MRSLLPFLVACTHTPQEAEEILADALDRAVERSDSVRHGVLHVDAAALSVSGQWSAGVASDGGEEMTPDTPFISASVGKLFTAATVMVLVEEGTLSLDDTLADHLDAGLIDGLPVSGTPGSITLDELLGHTSGLPDYFSDVTTDGADNVLTLMVEEPDRAWTPEALLDYTAAHFEAFGAPGETFHYADTNYDLLGLVVESATGLHFHEVVRAAILDPLGLEQTWYHSHEEPLSDAVADAWIGDHSVWDTAALSMDWAGGGLVTTAEDLAVFLRGLEAGDPVDLMSLQQSWTEDAMTRGIDYGYGLWRVDPRGVSRLLRGPEMIGVSGVTGSFAYLVPEHDAVITGTFDQTDFSEDHIVFLLTRVLPTLDRVE